MAVRIHGVNLPLNKRVEYGLTYVFGVGLKTSKDVLGKLKINVNKRVKELSDSEILAIEQELTKDYRVEGDLRREVQNNIRRLIEIGSYRGDRHRKGLPVRGQNTKNNARTRKGPKRAGGQIALKKKATKK